MNQCKTCFSYAVNLHCHGRDGSDSDLCDVCYYRKRLDLAREALEWANAELDKCTKPNPVTKALAQTKPKP